MSGQENKEEHHIAGEELPSKLDAVLGFLQKPWVCLSSALVGVLLGLYLPDFAKTLAPFGEIYMTLLTMTVTPIIFSALLTGVCRMLSSQDGRRYIGRTLATLVCGTLIASFLGVFLAASALPLLKPDNEKRDFIGAALSTMESNAPQTEEVKHGVLGFVQNFIPSNVMDALASDNLLAVVFVATLLGIALCKVSEKRRELASNFFEAAYETFITVLNWILYLLPAGLCCLMANQVSKVGAQSLKAMAVIIVLYLIGFLIMGALYLLLLCRATGKNLRDVFSTLKRPFTIGFIASSDSALPSLMEKMESLGYPRALVGSVIPLSAALNRHSTAMIFAITTVFVAQVYGMDLDLWHYLFIALVCAVVGAFDAGEYVTVAPMISYVLVPLGLPGASGSAIIMTIWPMIEWFPELQCVMAACANTAIAGNLAPGKTISNMNDNPERKQI
ncbi:MAG: hypothetical protein A2X49_11550 [Lentisphaerae bacterium GWF2_52_8]|nr:MAG: hypothetical protein A2X49_11550 [Lentisphaerae bacterium GWF2_52_8]